jgi:hypothetical protein
VFSYAFDWGFSRHLHLPSPYLTVIAKAWKTASLLASMKMPVF